MSTSHSDALINLLSRYLARHLSNDELLEELERLGTDGLPHDPSELVEELQKPGQKRGSVEVLVRETLEAIAFA